jgi:hypothetical protein
VIPLNTFLNAGNLLDKPLNDNGFDKALIKVGWVLVRDDNSVGRVQRLTASEEESDAHVVEVIGLVLLRPLMARARDVIKLALINNSERIALSKKRR